MSRNEVESLMRELGEKGLSPMLREKNIPPELLTLTEEAKEKLVPINFREYITAVEFLGLEIGEHTPGNLWWTLKKANLGVIIKAEQPLYEIDMAPYLSDYANADTRTKKAIVMKRHSINLIQSKEYMDTRALIGSIENGTLAEVYNIGKKMLGLSVALANQLIRDANEAV